MQLECKPDEQSNFSIIYATPVGGKRHFRFRDAEALAQHVSDNKPGMFSGVPYLGERYDEKMSQLSSRGYRLPSDD